MLIDSSALLLYFTIEIELERCSEIDRRKEELLFHNQQNKAFK